MSNLTHTNEVFGVYVTGGARMHLYVFLDRLQENAIYCDTDSSIFIQPGAEPCPIATGDKLGTCNLNCNRQYTLNIRQGVQKMMHSG